MKRLNWLMMLLTALTLSFAACTEPTPDKPNTDDPVKEDLKFEASVTETTRTSAFITVTPSDLEADYMSVVYPASAVEQCATDAELVVKIYAEFAAYAETVNKTFVEYMAEVVKRGVQENHEVKGLAQNTNYYLLVFGVDAAADYATTTDVTYVKFKTQDVQQSACTFTLKSEVYLTTAALTVTPSDNKQAWHLVNVPVEEMQKYTKEDGEYGWSQKEFFQYYLNTEIEALEAEGMTEDEIKTNLIFTGYRTLNASGLQAKTKYVALVGGVHYDAEGVVVTTELKELRYNAGEAAQNDLTFDVQVTNIEHYSADIKITPSDPTVEYYYYISYIDSPKKSMKPIDIANSTVTEYIWYWHNYTELKHVDPVTGVTELPAYALDIAETEYYIVVFSFDANENYGKLINEETGEYDSNPGTITSAPVYVSFKTPEHGDAYNAEFSFNFTEVGPYDFTFEVVSSDPSIYYQPGIAYPNGFSPEAAMQASAETLAMVMQMCMEGQNPCLTHQEALDKLKKQGYPYRNGSAKFYVANLEPNTTYMGYVLAIDVKTGRFAKCYFDLNATVTTSAVGNVDPTVEVLGVYNGDEENGSIFGDAAMTAGRPIIAVTHKNIEGASALFTAISTDTLDDVNALSDRYIISEFRGYWSEITNLDAPYEFFIGEWDIDQTVVSYAQDANGAEGKVARLGVKPVQVNDIEELRAYVNERNGASASAVRQSLVVNEAAAPTMECIWNEEVGTFRGAEVIYHEVEALELPASDLMTVKVVKSFAF
ncbi:MAG: hypothetical protein IKY89_07815 [Alistipes sp.]|nr:hypothetical protein [Alistipes sp.]